MTTKIGVTEVRTSSFKLTSELTSPEFSPAVQLLTNCPNRRRVEILFLHRAGRHARQFSDAGLTRGHSHSLNQTRHRDWHVPNWETAAIQTVPLEGYPHAT